MNKRRYRFKDELKKLKLVISKQNQKDQQPALKKTVFCQWRK
jgi:hypothetical protein